MATTISVTFSEIPDTAINLIARIHEQTEVDATDKSLLNANAASIFMQIESESPTRPDRHRATTATYNYLILRKLSVHQHEHDLATLDSPQPEAR